MARLVHRSLDVAVGPHLPVSWIFSVGKCLGFVGYHAAHSRRRIAQVNIAKCFPELDAEQRRRLVQANFSHTGIGIIETALPWLNPARICPPTTEWKG